MLCKSLKDLVAMATVTACVMMLCVTARISVAVADTSVAGATSIAHEAPSSGEESVHNALPADKFFQMLADEDASAEYPQTTVYVTVSLSSTYMGRDSITVINPTTADQTQLCSGSMDYCKSSNKWTTQLTRAAYALQSITFRATSPPDYNSNYIIPIQVGSVAGKWVVRTNKITPAFTILQDANSYPSTIDESAVGVLRGFDGGVSRSRFYVTVSGPSHSNLNPRLEFLPGLKSKNMTKAYPYDWIRIIATAPDGVKQRVRMSIRLAQGHERAVNDPTVANWEIKTCVWISNGLCRNFDTVPDRIVTRWAMQNITGFDREALVFAPLTSSSDGKVPVVFVFHGHGGTAFSVSQKMSLHTTGLWDQALVIYPQGLPGIKGKTDPAGIRPGWQKIPEDKNDRDVHFFDELLAKAKSMWNLDLENIHITGHSNGGAFTFVLLQQRGSIITTSAVSASLPGFFSDQSKKILPGTQPLLFVACPGDTVVAYATIQAAIAQYVAQRKCGIAHAWNGDKNTSIYDSPDPAQVGDVLFKRRPENCDHSVASYFPDLAIKFMKTYLRIPSI